MVAWARGGCEWILFRSPVEAGLCLLLLWISLLNICSSAVCVHHASALAPGPLGSCYVCWCSNVCLHPCLLYKFCLFGKTCLRMASGCIGTYMWLFISSAGRVAQKVLERILFNSFVTKFVRGLHRTYRNVYYSIALLRSLWGGCTERIGTYCSAKKL